LVVALEHDEDVLRGRDAAEQLDDGLGRGRVTGGEGLDGVDAGAACAVRESAEQSSGDHLLRGALRVAARRRAVDDATTGHLRGTDRALTSATGSLLLER